MCHALGMCYSAQIEASYRKFVYEHCAIIDIHEFVKLYGHRAGTSEWSKIPKTMRYAFRKPENESGFELAKIVADGDRALEESLQVELAAQQARLDKAVAVLAGAKPTKKASDDQRIATRKITVKATVSRR